MSTEPPARRPAGPGAGPVLDRPGILWTKPSPAGGRDHPESDPGCRWDQAGGTVRGRGRAAGTVGAAGGSDPGCRWDRAGGFGVGKGRHRHCDDHSSRVLGWRPCQRCPGTVAPAAPASRGDDRSHPPGLTPQALLRAVIETSDDAIFTVAALGEIAHAGAPPRSACSGCPAGRRDRPAARQSCSLRTSVPRSAAMMAAGRRRRTRHPLRDRGAPPRRHAGADLAVGMPGRPTGHSCRLPPWSWPGTSPNSAWPRPPWPRSRCDSRRARPWPTSGSWLWDVRTGTVQWSTEFHRIHDLDPL